MKTHHAKKISLTHLLLRLPKESILLLVKQKNKETNG